MELKDTCSLEEALTNLDSILKSKDITLLTKVYIVKATGFSWIFIGRTDAEAEPPIPWSPDVKSRLIRKDHDVEKDWRQEEKGMTEDEMLGWHHWLDRHEFQQARWWRTGKPGMLLSMESQRVGRDWVTEKQLCVGAQSRLILVTLLFFNHLLCSSLQLIHPIF